MSYLTVILVALGLSMDAFAVSVSEGLTLRQYKIRNALKLALFFGMFQAIMPVIGWLAGQTIRSHIQAIDHWIAFGLLSLIGIKMIYESFIEKKGEKNDRSLQLHTLFILAIATSIDALAIGITFSFLKVTILTPVVIIGIITFINSLIGYFLGEKFGRIFGNKIEFAGGIILILIGFKILIEHLS